MRKLLPSWKEKCRGSRSVKLMPAGKEKASAGPSLASPADMKVQVLELIEWCNIYHGGALLGYDFTDGGGTTLEVHKKMRAIHKRMKRIALRRDSAKYAESIDLMNQKYGKAWRAGKGGTWAWECFDEMPWPLQGPCVTLPCSCAGRRAIRGGAEAGQADIKAEPRILRCRKIMSEVNLVGCALCSQRSYTRDHSCPYD